MEHCATASVAPYPDEWLDRVEALLAGRGFAVEHRGSRTLAVPDQAAAPAPRVGSGLVLLFVVPGLA